MPIIQGDHGSQPRHVPVWWLIAAALLPSAIVAWSWYDPIVIHAGRRTIIFGALYGDVSRLGPGWHRFPIGWNYTLDLPRRSGVYTVSWIVHRTRPLPSLDSGDTPLR